MPFRSKAQQRYMYAQHREIADRWTNEMRGGKNASKEQKEHPIKHAGLPNKVGKRATGGSFESGPSTIAVGVSRGTVRRGRVSSSRFGGTPGHGRRYGPEPGLERFNGRGAGPPSRVAKAVPFQATSVLSRAGKLGQTLDTGMKTVQEGMRAGQIGSAPMASPVGAGAPGNTTAGKAGKILLGTGQKLGQATASPARAATTGGAIGAAGTAATMGVMGGQKDPNQVGKALVPDSPDHRRQLANQAREMNRSAVQEEKRQARAKPQFHGSRPRNYDPEAHRQRRLGAAQGVANTAGAASLAAGAHSYRKLNVTRRAIGQGERIVNRTTAGRLAGGAAALAAGEKIRRHANDPRNRAWR